MIQTCFHESDFVKTTKTSYDKKLNDVLEDPSNTALYGIRESPDLNSLKYFHITNNHMLDLFHDIREGTAKYEVKFLLHRFIKIDKLFDLRFLNERIILFNYGIIEKKNRPNPRFRNPRFRNFAINNNIKNLN